MPFVHQWLCIPIQPTTFISGTSGNNIDDTLTLHSVISCLWLDLPPLQEIMLPIPYKVNKVKPVFLAPESTTAEPETEMDQDALLSENSDGEVSEGEVSEGEEEEEFDQQRAQEIFDDWMVSLRLDQRRMLAVIVMKSFKCRQRMNVKDAAQEAGLIVGFKEKTVRRHRNGFFNNEGYLTETKQGKYEWHCVYHDEDLNQWCS